LVPESFFSFSKVFDQKLSRLFLAARVAVAINALSIQKLNKQGSDFLLRLSQGCQMVYFQTKNPKMGLGI
jgi:hypothetical protein